MKAFTASAGIAAIAALVAISWSQAAERANPNSGFDPKPYFEMPLEKDPSRQVRLQSVIIPPGVANQFHRHPGDQWWTVQEGEITYTVKGQAPRVMRVGDYVYVPRGTIHRNANTTNRPARAVELNITDKDKPQTEVVPD